jgi:hypothetical protein
MWPDGQWVKWGDGLFSDDYGTVQEADIGLSLDPIGEGVFGTHTIGTFSLPFQDRIFGDHSRVYRFYAGQRNSTDPSRFTVDFDVDDQRVRIHCQLVATSRLQVRFESITPEGN